MGNGRYVWTSQTSTEPAQKTKYPLPQIDKLIDKTFRYQLLSLMDAYYGYNQICMNSTDDPKKTFMTNKNKHYHEVMPFGLKNARATYQRLMDRIFATQI